MQLDQTYKPENFEKQLYKTWEERNYFKANVNKNKKPFTIIMPPPNITSRLHIGHSYGITIMDMLTRFKRMQGYEALLLPGNDHAAIATEAKVVDKLKEQGLTKHDLGREKFMEKMQEWYDEYGAAINEQFKLVGISCDWDRFAFTLDEPRSLSVKKSFVELYNKGLIYQGDRITNWCVSCNTALSDIEVEYEENVGSLWHIKYQIENFNNFIAIATTRPETLLGDTAVAVNPSDERYKHLVGKNVILPLVNKTIPVIADDYVDSAFGTGVVKITPAHDPNDYEVGQRHNLPEITIMTKEGFINENGGQYAGLERFEARAKIVADLEKIGQLIKVEKHDNKVGHCQRCHTVVEPMISKQWFVKMKELAERAVKVVEDKEIKFIPERFEKTYFNWMNNIKDWCISRQIWSGHRIPVFYEEGSTDPIVEFEDPRTMEKYAGKTLVQDPDSLDTWFSSALWPFSTLGWPENTEEMGYFFPTDVMITAYDIIFFWVARMIFSSLEYTDKIPFKEVLMHGLIRDGEGRKMSKSLGNGVDPLEIIEKYGTDSLRYSLIYGTNIGTDVKYDEDKALQAKIFINKLYNASKYVILKTDNFEEQNPKQYILKNKNKLTNAQKWILTELNTLVKEATKNIEKYELGVALSKITTFVWNSYCDWYIEISKLELASQDEEVKKLSQAVLLFVLDSALKLLHPVTPFVTEHIFQNLKTKSETIMLEAYPEYVSELNFKKESALFEDLMNQIRQVRNIRAEFKVPDNKKIDLFVKANQNIEFYQENAENLKKLTTASNVTFVETELSEDDFIALINLSANYYLPKDQLSDKEEQNKRKEEEISRLKSEIERSNKMLSNPGFVSKAPQSLIATEKEKLEKNTLLLEKLLNS